jgi:hypothetical protein
MTNLVKLTTNQGGADIYVNPDQVRLVKSSDSDSNCTLITFDQTHHWAVKEDLATVISKLTGI